MRGLRGSAFAALALAFGAAQARADDLMGQPTPGAFDLQPAASILKHQAIQFHNWILMPIVTAIAIAGWFGLRETFHDDLDYLEK